MKQSEHQKYNLEELLLVFRRNILEVLKKEGFKYDLTFSQMEVLRFLGRSGKETMHSIASYLQITPPSATEIVSELEKRGLVKRHGDKKDRRLVFIVPTSVVKKLCSSIFKRKNAVLKKMTSKLSKKDKLNLERIIRILIAD